MNAQKGQSSIGRYGEALFRRYIRERGIPFEFEPILDADTRRIDFVLHPPGQEQIYVEVKTVYNPPPTKSGAACFDPYVPIRAEIAEGMRKFRSLPNSLNAIALVAFPGGFLDIDTPYIMLGAMYGDAGFSIPFDREEGRFKQEGMSETFLQGRGMMVRKAGPRNSRLSALISVHNADYFFPKIPLKGMSIGEAASMLTERVEAIDFANPHLTVWDNAAGKRVLPTGLFEGQMDARWSYDGEAQFQSFVGVERRARQIGFLESGITRY